MDASGDVSMDGAHALGDDLVMGAASGALVGAGVATALAGAGLAAGAGAVGAVSSQPQPLAPSAALRSVYKEDPTQALMEAIFSREIDGVEAAIADGADVNHLNGVRDATVTRVGVQMRVRALC